MRTFLETKAPEEGTYAVDFAFTDENGDAVTPKSGLTWTLTDELGNVVNSRLNIAIASASTVTVVLSGADLALSTALAGRTRCLIVKGTYDSDLGNDLPLRNEAVFDIEDYVGES